MKIESSFKSQTSKHKPKASLRSGGSKLIFKKKLAVSNRAILWVSKERHEQVEQIADVTGMTMSQLVDVMLRFAMANCTVVDAGKDYELLQYIDSLMGVETIAKDDNSGSERATAEQDDAQGAGDVDESGKSSSCDGSDGSAAATT